MVKLKQSISILLLLSGMLLNGCLDSYERSERTIQVTPFNSIKLHSVFVVVLIQANTYSVKIIADEDVIEDIHVEVGDGTLELTDNSNYKWTKPESTRIRLEITAPSFQSIVAEQSYSLSTQGELQIDQLSLVNFPKVKISDVDLTLNGGYFFYWNNWLAGGKLKLQGSIQTLDASNYALHIIDARELATQSATLHNFGRENCRVNVSSHFEYSLNGPGDIILYGNPPEIVELEKTSTGKLITGN